MQRAERDRYARKQCRNAQARLYQEREEQQIAVHRVAAAPPRHPNQDQQEPEKSTVHKLHRRHVVEEVPPPWLEQHDLWWYELSVHQRESVVCVTRAQASHHASRKRHDKDDDREPDGERVEVLSP